MTRSAFASMALGILASRAWLTPGGLYYSTWHQIKLWAVNSHLQRSFLLQGTLFSRSFLFFVWCIAQLKFIQISVSARQDNSEGMRSTFGSTPSSCSSISPQIISVYLELDSSGELTVLQYGPFSSRQFFYSFHQYLAIAAPECTCDFPASSRVSQWRSISICTDILDIVCLYGQLSIPSLRHSLLKLVGPLLQ